MRPLLPKRGLAAATLLAAVVLLGASFVVGCSVLDGWGGLEGEPKDAKPDGGQSADGGGSGSSSGSSGALCGTAHCDLSKGEGCCLDPTGATSYCATSCNGGPLLMCDNSAQCADLYDAAAVCCFSYAGGGSGGFTGSGGPYPGGSSGATCTTGTCAGAELCSPTTGCTGGRRCVQTRGYYICM